MENTEWIQEVHEILNAQIRSSYRLSPTPVAVLSVNITRQRCQSLRDTLLHSRGLTFKLRPSLTYSQVSHPHQQRFVYDELLT